VPHIFTTHFVTTHTYTHTWDLKKSTPTISWPHISVSHIFTAYFFTTHSLPHKLVISTTKKNKWLLIICLSARNTHIYHTSRDYCAHTHKQELDIKEERIDSENLFTNDEFLYAHMWTYFFFTTVMGSGSWRRKNRRCHPL